MMMSDEELSRRVKDALPRLSAPPELAAGIRAALAAEGEVARPLVAQPRAPARTWWRTAAALVLMAAVGSVSTSLWMQRRAAESGVAEQVLASHIRSLMPGHLTDVASTDQHNVKPWFNGRVNVSPPVPRLDSAGFPLVGGRVDYIDGRAAAAVVYARRGHVINVIAWAEPGERDAAPVESTKNGYHLIYERRDGLELWFVSDLNAAELEDFAQRYATSR